MKDQIDQINRDVHNFFDIEPSEETTLTVEDISYEIKYTVVVSGPAPENNRGEIDTKYGKVGYSYSSADGNYIKITYNRHEQDNAFIYLTIMFMPPPVQIAKVIVNSKRHDAEECAGILLDEIAFSMMQDLMKGVLLCRIG